MAVPFCLEPTLSRCPQIWRSEPHPHVPPSNGQVSFHEQPSYILGLGWKGVSQLKLLETVWFSFILVGLGCVIDEREVEASFKACSVFWLIRSRGGLQSRTNVGCAVRHSWVCSPALVLQVCDLEQVN